MAAVLDIAEELLLHFVGMSTIRPRAPKLYRALRRAYRILRAPYRAARRIRELLIDHGLNVETAHTVHLAELGPDTPHRLGYEAAGWLTLHRILRPREVSPDDVFLDLGSGKGRGVLMAARYPFKRVIGVEVSERLTAIAQRNLASCRARPWFPDVSLVCADVVDYRVPDDVSVVYMFNPFRGSVFDAAIERLIESIDRRPRTVRLIYRNPVEHDRLVRTGRARLIREARGLPPILGRDVRLYVLEPNPASEAQADERTPEFELRRCDEAVASR